MNRTLALIAGLVLTLTITSGLALGFTFSVDGGPAGSVPVPYSDGSLITFTAPGVYGTTSTLSGYPIDAIHVGAPVRNVIMKTANGYRIVSPIFFSLDDGHSFPIGADNASAEEIYVANKWASGAPDGTNGTATFGELLNTSSTLPALESNLSLGVDGISYNDNLDALDVRNYSPSTDILLFSIDDLVPFVPNAPSAMQTRDIFVRLPGTGSIVKVIDGFLNVGLTNGSVFNLCDDIDALIMVEVDDNPANNKYVDVVDEANGQHTLVNLGDGILFSVDRDLPDPDGGGPLRQYGFSIDPSDVYFSPLDGSAPVLVIDAQEAYLASSGPLGLNEGIDLDALAAFGYENEIPEPATLLLLGTGLISIAGVLRRKGITD